MAKGTAKSADLDASMRIVVLYGEERFLIEDYTRRFAEALEEHFGGLETFTFDGETVAPATVLDELRSYGLLQKHKLVILDNADEFLAGKSRPGDEAGEDDVESSKGSRRPLMEKYAANPVQDATLLMRASGWRAGKVDKLIQKVGAIIEFKPMREGEAANWCVQNAEVRHGVRIEAPAAHALVGRLGPHLQQLDVELAKLAAAAGPAGTITRQIVGDMTEPSREEKAWQIESAVLSGQAGAMLRKLHELMAISRHDVVPLTWAIVNTMRKLHLAAQLHRQGTPFGTIIKQAQLWGDAVNPAMAIARQTEPAVLAQLLQRAITVDMHNKSGVGDPSRSLEALLVEIADTIGEE